MSARRVTISLALLAVSACRGDTTPPPLYTAAVDAPAPAPAVDDTPPAEPTPLLVVLGLALLGGARALRAAGRPHGVLSSPIEHPAVLESLARLEGLEAHARAVTLRR